MMPEPPRENRCPPHRWDAGAWGVIIGVSRCLDCGTTATRKTLTMAAEPTREPKAEDIVEEWLALCNLRGWSPATGYAALADLIDNAFAPALREAREEGERLRACLESAEPWSDLVSVRWNEQAKVYVSRLLAADLYSQATTPAGAIAAILSAAGLWIKAAKEQHGELAARLRDVEGERNRAYADLDNRDALLSTQGETIASLRALVAALREALQALYGLVEAKILVRATERDGDFLTFAQESIRLVNALKATQDALEASPAPLRERGAGERP